jgi:F-type H+-transporting ATPase subunit b
MLLAATSGSSGSSNNFLLPNMTFFVELIAFIIILGLIARYILPPIQRAIQQRQDEIQDALTQAEQAKQEKLVADQEYRAKLDEARHEARTVIERANRMAEQLREDARNKGQEEYDRVVARADADIQRATERAREELRLQVADLVIAAAERVIGEELDPERHRALIDQAIAGVGTGEPTRASPR